MIQPTGFFISFNDSPPFLRSAKSVCMLARPLSWRGIFLASLRVYGRLLWSPSVFVSNNTLVGQLSEGICCIDGLNPRFGHRL